MKVTIIGGGHIGGACAFGFKKAGHDVTVTARSAGTLAKYEGSGITAITDNRRAASSADIVILAVRTAQMKEVLEELHDLLSDRTAVSMAAQVTAEEISRYAPHLIYAIPNTAAQFAESVTFLSDISAGEERLSKVRDLFSSVGKCFAVDYSMLPAGISLASCGIGFAMKYMTAATEGGIRMGFTKEEAAEIVCRTVLGACKVVESSGFRPDLELGHVATPGGLTEKGVKTMDSNGFTDAVVKGLESWRT